MMSIGISSSTDRGHLTLDEEKLKKALAAEPDCVRELFNSSGDYTDKNGKVQTDYDKQGVIGRISDSLYKNLKTMKSYAGTTTEASDGSSLGDLIRELQTKMSNFKTMMKSYENLLYKKYDAMEVAIQRMSVSMGYITGGQ
jgi:flagellar hook-associated protein 2